jgi:hypothetical protein
MHASILFLALSVFAPPSSACCDCPDKYCCCNPCTCFGSVRCSQTCFCSFGFVRHDDKKADPKPVVPVYEWQQSTKYPLQINLYLGDKQVGCYVPHEGRYWSLNDQGQFVQGTPPVALPATAAAPQTYQAGPSAGSCGPGGCSSGSGSGRFFRRR